jgi:flagellar motor switch protein FliN/FliY
MAPKKAKTEDGLEIGDNSAELDQAIDDLRGVLKADADGATDIGGDFGGDFPAFDGGDTASAGLEQDFTGTSDFGDASGFDAGGDFGAGLGASSFDDSAFGGALPHSTSSGRSEPGNGMHQNLDLIMDIPIDVQIILGSSRMQVSGLMNLNEGAIISLDRRIGEPVDLMVNGRLIGRGEITVMENDETRFGIRLIEVKSVTKA